MTVTIEKTEFVWTIVHDRFEEARNAMDPASADALVAAMLAFDADRQARVAVLYGQGGAFCAGWDLKYASTLADRNKFDEDIAKGLAIPEGEAQAPRGPLGPTRLALSKPVIAAVEGPAVAGGMELAMWCDVRVMAENAYFGVYCRRWGIPLSGFVALLKKRIANDVVLGYSGEAYFYAWARQNAKMVAAPFGAVKDVSVLFSCKLLGESHRLHCSVRESLAQF